jgi:hypothetical protein
VRHIQLKSTVVRGRTATQKIHTALASHGSGCVVWLVLQRGGGNRLECSFLTFGSEPGERLTGLERFKVARHAKGNSEGVKKLRPAIRDVPKSAFVARADITAVSDWLFGAASNTR